MSRSSETHWPAGQAEGEARKRADFDRFRTRRLSFLRGCQRALLQNLLERGEATIDDVRAVVPIPPNVNPKTIGATPTELAVAGIIADSVRAEKSRRPEAHARKITVWQLIDRHAALAWLDEHPEIPDPGDDGEDAADPSSREHSPPSSPTRSASATPSFLF